MIMNKTELRSGPYLAPLPAVLVSCGDAKGNRNIITIAWVGVLASDPPSVAIGVAPARYSHGLITSSREFVINLPHAEQMELLDYSGTRSGREGDKFTATGVEAVPAAKLRWAPLIDACPVNLECKVTHQIALGSHDAFIGEVVAAHGWECWLDENGKLAPALEQLVAYVAGSYTGVRPFSDPSV